MTSPERFKLIPAVYLILLDDDRVLMHQRANSGYQDGTYGLVSGHLDGDELSTDALVREAREEAGIEIDPAHLAFAHLVHRLSRDAFGQERMDLFFTTTNWQGVISNREPQKCTDLSWFQLDDLPSRTLPFIRRVLTDVRRGVTYSQYTHEPPDDVEYGCWSNHQSLR